MAKRVFEVAKELNKGFVCAWKNKTPQARFPDGMHAYLKNGKQGLGNGAGVTNVTAIFATADGELLHAMPGYLDPQSFLRHLAFAKTMHAQLAGVRREDRAGVYQAAHEKAVREGTDDLDKGAHRLLAPRLMRIDELPLGYFNKLARVLG